MISEGREIPKWKPVTVSEIAPGRKVAEFKNGIRPSFKLLRTWPYLILVKPIIRISYLLEQ